MSTLNIGISLGEVRLVPKGRLSRRRALSWVLRWLILCFPVGLFFLWSRRCRLRPPRKAFLTAVTLMCAWGVTMGTLSLYPTQEKAYAGAALRPWQAHYMLLVDPDEGVYHVNGCVHVQWGAVPITLEKAAQKQITPDERCNPPRYNSRN